jgi:hypothetical protein
MGAAAVGLGYAMSSVDFMAMTGQGSDAAFR